MTWAAVIIWLAAAISTRTPSACLTPDAEQFAVSAAIGEAYWQPALSHELVMGAIVEHNCEADPNFIGSYRAALAGNPYHARAFFDPWSFVGSRVNALHQRWKDTLIQHYGVRHFDAANAPRAWWWDSPAACPRGEIVVGDMRFC